MGWRDRGTAGVRARGSLRLCVGRKGIVESPRFPSVPRVLELDANPYGYGRLPSVMMAKPNVIPMGAPCAASEVPGRRDLT